jgi:hypothetical protein
VHACAIEEVELADVRHVEHGEQRLEIHLDARLLQRLAQRPLLRGLAELHEARRQRPVAAPRLDIAQAEQHAAFPHGHRADDVQGFS